jgi:hypothetical protein
MRRPTPLWALTAAAAIALATGCSGGPSSTIASQPSAQNTSRHFESFNACPAVGPITYISDYVNGVINIYAGDFLGQGKCGQIGGLNSQLVFPEGMFVRMPGHKLYVADRGGNDILVFERGASRPSNVYVDPNGPFPSDVTVAGDGTVIASNAYSNTGGPGSISTWRSGPNGGHFVGNFPMVNDIQGLYVTVLPGPNNTIYYNDVDVTSGAGVLYTGNCPLGVCGPFTPVGPNANTKFPGGLRSGNAGTVLFQIDQEAARGGAMIKYSVPQFPHGVACAIGGRLPTAFDMNGSGTRVFYADARRNVGTEMTDTCKPIGRPVPGNLGGQFFGLAHDGR